MNLFLFNLFKKFSKSLLGLKFDIMCLILAGYYVVTRYAFTSFYEIAQAEKHNTCNIISIFTANIKLLSPKPQNDDKQSTGCCFEDLNIANNKEAQTMLEGKY